MTIANPLKNFFFSDISTNDFQLETCLFRGAKVAGFYWFGSELKVFLHDFSIISEFYAFSKQNRVKNLPIENNLPRLENPFRHIFVASQSIENFYLFV